jgi:zinc protease
VVIVGDVTLDRVRSLAEKYYGVVPRRDVAPRLRPQEPPQIAARRVIMDDPRVRQASWTRSYLAPSSRAGDTKLAIPLMLLADILGGGETSRLHRALVLGDGIATGAGAGYDALSLELSTFDVYARPKQGVSLDKIEAGVNGVIADLLKGGITPDELARAKTGYRAGAIYGRDSNDATARLFGSALVVGLDVESVETFIDRVDATTAEQVENAARAVFDLRHSVTGTLSPKPAS